MTTQAEKTLASAVHIIARFPKVEPDLGRRNPLCFYDSYSATHAYRFAREAGEMGGVGFTHKAIDIGENNALDYVRGWAKRLFRPSLIVTRTVCALDKPREGLNRPLYEVWYVRPETTYQTLPGAGWGRYPRYWSLMAEIADGKYPQFSWSYGNVTLFGPHWTFVCRHCGAEQPFLYNGRPLHTGWEQMLDDLICGTCRHFLDTCAHIPARDRVIISGVHYAPGEESDRSGFRGFGGQRFRIRFNDGREVVSTNLWCQGTIPEALRERFPDRFADNAVFVQEER